MPYAEADLLPLSALQHLLFCERQCALIHVERLWEDNALTAKGNVLHQKVHQPGTENRPGLKTCRSLRIHSFSLGVYGQTDVVEFLHTSDDQVPTQVRPIEYKKGRPKSHQADEVQLCAQAICLEEMLNVTITEGFLFYGEKRRRHEVKLTVELRELTRETATRLHQTLNNPQLPRAKYFRGCDQCSLIEHCYPKITMKQQSATDYLERMQQLAIMNTEDDLT